MSRKSLIWCVSVLVVMVAAIGLAICFLYSGSGDSHADAKASILSQDKYRALGAVPSDAMMVMSFGSAQKASSGPCSGFFDLGTVMEQLEKRGLSDVLARPLTVSVHYSGRPIGLYLFDLTGISEGSCDILESVLSDQGFYCGKASDLLLASDSQSLLNSGLRHFEQKLCVLDAPGFISAVEAATAGDVLLVSNAQARHLMKSVFKNRIFKYAGFVESVAEWTVMDMSSAADRPVGLSGRFVRNDDPEIFMNVFGQMQPSVSTIAEVLPSFVTFAATIPLSDFGTYVHAYSRFLDSKQRLQAYRITQQQLADRTGVSPADFFNEIAVKEVGTASFMVGNTLESINLIKVGNENSALLREDGQIPLLQGVLPTMREWNYGGFAASVFGDLFALKDESHFTYLGGWLISGSQSAISQYVSKGIWKYTLQEYGKHAGKSDLISGRPSLFVGYFSFTSPGVKLSDYVETDMRRVLAGMTEAEYSPAVLYVGKQGGEFTMDFNIFNLSLSRTKAPEYEMDATVDVPSGPFTVKNSHTKKNNTFYQNSSMAICLRDEKGKDLWGVPLGKPICGTAHNVDYYANGRLQIIFGAGSSIYVIDRLGRYVSGFPLDLESEIAIGPDVYDFSGAKKYNIMVLHKDNTIQMYNLKGKKPDKWQGITAGETIKSLPERLTVRGSDYWVVRTSIQTLIFPFYGGKPVTTFTGDRRIRPDSKVVINGDSVTVDCYDGRSRSVRLK